MYKIIFLILSLFMSVFGIPAAQSQMLPLALSTQGNKIMRGGGQFIFHGVNRDSLEWGQSNWGGCGGDGHFTDADFNNIASWRINTIRIPLSEAGWLGRSCDAATYIASVDAVVAKIKSRNQYAILDLHWSDVNGLAPCDGGCNTGQQPMPDSDSVIFWNQVARRYANNPNVIFGLYNEPHDVSWSCWRNGGCTVVSSTNPGVSYRAVGMQTLYNAVRSQGANNLVLAGGLLWAYDLSGINRGFALNGVNIAYDTHVYTHWHYTTSDWNAGFGQVSLKYPVVSTEFGSIDCTSTQTAPLLAYFKTHKISWTIWSWNSPGECTQPSIIADWNGTPLPSQGTLIHNSI